MFKEERYNQILELLEKETYMSVEMLSKRLFVSLPTVRRDLAELQRRKLILRSHGGAKKLNDESSVTPLDFRKTVHYKEKRLLCQAAARFIQDNDILFLDASTTVLQMADFIVPQSAVTVVTNSILLSTLLSKKGIKVFCTGGEAQQNSMCYAGSFAESFVRSFNFDKVFFSSHGISPAHMIVDTSLQETLLRRAVLEQSKQSFFLCDTSKFFLSAAYNLAAISDIDYMITDDEGAASITCKKQVVTI